MEIKDLIAKIAEYDEMEAPDGMNIVEATEEDIKDLANKDEQEAADGMNLLEDETKQVNEGATNGPTYDNIIAEYSKYIPQRTNVGEQTAETCKIAIALLDDIWRTIQDDEDTKDIADTILECIDGISNFVPELQ